MTIAGKIAESVYWYDGLTEWLKLNPLSPPQVPPNTVFYLGFFWHNTGDVQARGHVDATLNEPDGTQVPLVLMSGRQDQVVNPGAVVGLLVRFEAVTLDKAGTYSVSIVLSMEEVAAPPPPLTVTVTIRARNAPPAAVCWVVFVSTIYGYPYPIPAITSGIVLSNVPADSPIRGILVQSYSDAAATQPVASPNTGYSVGFSRLFENGKTYYWDFASGLLLDENLQAM